MVIDLMRQTTIQSQARIRGLAYSVSLYIYIRCLADRLINVNDPPFIGPLVTETVPV